MVDNITILNNEDVKITHVYHFADIHIKANISSDLNKHYVDMINNIEKQIKLQKNNDTSLVCICGDIIDSIYSTECIKIIKLLFNKLASLCPVIYIAGNHDLANKRNIEISDMITPLIHEYFDSKHQIYPLLKEGLYMYGNIIFGVTSMGSLDVFPCTIKNKEYKNKIKIGLFHGQVSFPDLDPIIKKQCDLDVSQFKKYYDYVLLGDRHIFGYLDKQKTVAYCGSTYEVNYRETDTKKGFIMWDITNNKNTKFIELDGLIKHKVLKIKDNKIEKYDKKNMAEMTKIKIMYDDDTKIDKLNEIEKKIKKDINVIECIIEKDFSSTNLNTSVIINNKQKTVNDIKSYDIVIKMITDHIKEKYKPNKKMLESIDLYLKKLIKTTDFNFFEKPSTFKLKKIEFDNINSYGEGNVINFNLFNNKIVEVSGRNGTGKSSILTVLLLGLYNECDVGTKYDCLNIKNINKPATIKIEFEVNGCQYKINKKISVRSHIKRECHEDLLLYKDDVDITGQDNIETQKKIINLVGTYDNIIDTNIILQRNYKAFTDLSNNDKKKVISKISKLDVFDLLAKQVRSELASLQKKGPMLIKQICELVGCEDKKEYESAENTMVVDTDVLRDEIYDLNKEKDTLTKKFESLNKSKIELEYELKDFKQKTVKTVETLKELKKKLSNESKELEKLEKKLADTKKRLSLKKFNNFEDKIKEFDCDKKKEINLLTNQKEKLLLSINTIQFSESSFKKKIDDVKLKINKIDKKIKNLDDAIVEKFKEWEKIKLHIDTQNKKVININTNIKKFKDQQKHINKIDHNPDCKFCVNLLNKITFVENIQILDEELKNVEKDLSQNIKKLKKYNNVEEDYKEYIESLDDNKKYESELICLKKDLKMLEDEYVKNLEIEMKNTVANNQIRTLNDEIKEKEESVLKNHDRYNVLTKRLNFVENEIKEKNKVIMSIREKIDNYENINKQKKLNNMLDEHSKLDKKLKAVTTKIINKTKIIVENDLKLKQITKIKKEIDEVKDDKQIVEYINKTLEKDGIQDTILINNIIPKLQQEVNSLLNTLSNFNIEIKYLNKTLQVYKIIGKKNRILKLSGYEHMILGLCFRLVFCGLAQQKCKFVCFDEIFTFADDNGIQKIGQLFEYVRSRFDYAIVISHNDNIKKFCDVSLNIKKENGFSVISKHK